MNAGKPDPAHTDACPNCGVAVGDARYCPRCGQRQGTLIPSVGAWLRDALEETLFLEGRLPRTLGRLFWPPGSLTLAWRKGRRASFVHPLRLYLLAAALFFVPWTLSPGGGFVVSILVDDIMQRTGALPDYQERSYVPAAPLTLEEARDPAARARWQVAFEERRAEAGERAADRRTRIQAGAQRVTDILPLLVGLLMVPVLAGMSHLLVAPRRWRRTPRVDAPRFMEHLVLATHVHAVAYVVFGALVIAVWMAGSPDWGLLAWPLGLAVTTVYFAAALRRNFGGGATFLFVAVALVPVLYITVFWAVSRAAVRFLVAAGVIS